jgi:hypothetical protein
MMKRFFCLIMTAAALFASESGDGEMVVRQALEYTLRTPDSLFHHLRLTRRNQEQLVEEYNPTQPQPWNLLLIDGKKPEKGQVDDFLKRKNSRQGQQRDLNSMLDYSSLRLLELTETTIRYQFKPVFEEDRLQNAPMKGELTIITKDGKPWIKQIIIENYEPLSPAPLVKFEAFKMSIEYTQDSKGEYILPARFAMLMKGKALGLKEIDLNFESLYGRWRLENSLINVPNDSQFGFLQ